LFNSQYLSRGLALYHSLVQHALAFHLYIYAFDNKVDQILRALNLPNVTVISLNEFETPELLNIKSTRTIGEYCWTCTPAVILHSLEKYNIDSVCYLDADLFFWGDPKILLTEVAEGSILLTEHRYTKRYDYAEISGKYCVQFMYFRNDTRGLAALTWWRDACLDWCFDRVEPHRFGDQKYLDDWLVRFEGVKVLKHLGGGVAPWNVQQYRVVNTTDGILLREENEHLTFNLIFYHFHGLKFVNQSIDCGTYKLSKEIIRHVYKPYIEQLHRQEKFLQQNLTVSPLLSNVNIHCHVKKEKTMRERLRNIKRKILGTDNTLSLESIWPNS
jgi:hypothetical protein